MVMQSSHTSLPLRKNMVLSLIKYYYPENARWQWSYPKKYSSNLNTIFFLIQMYGNVSTLRCHKVPVLLELPANGWGASPPALLPLLCRILHASPWMHAEAARMPANKYACILNSYYSENIQWENGNILHLISQTLLSTS